MMTSLKEKLAAIPHGPGCYLMRDAAGQIVYIGKARDLAKRVSSYFHAKDLSPTVVGLLSTIRHIDYITANSEREALLLEQRLIQEHQPRYNIEWRDDKSYPYLKLTYQDDFPRLILTRKLKRDGGKYFGPYPHVRGVRKLLKWLHKSFRLRQCKLTIHVQDLPDPQKVLSCLYLAMDQCPAPCLGRISKKDYGQIAKETELFLSGEHEHLLQQWEKQMQEASRGLRYEEAAKYRDLIQTLEHMHERINLRRITALDIEQSVSRTRAVTLLKESLRLEKPPVVIEAFDISNIQGYEPVASLVVFKSGHPHKADYRHFKIKSVRGIDDFAMMAEVVTRRYRRLIKEGRSWPDLILIDGGKGQLSSAVQALKKLGIKKQPVLGLAKRLEEIYLPDQEKPLVLAKDSPALHILQHIRDEAHRFAISFYRSRHRKSLLPRS